MMSKCVTFEKFNPESGIYHYDYILSEAGELIGITPIDASNLLYSNRDNLPDEMVVGYEGDNMDNWMRQMSYQLAFYFENKLGFDVKWPDPELEAEYKEMRSTAIQFFNNRYAVIEFDDWARWFENTQSYLIHYKRR